MSIAKHVRSVLPFAHKDMPLWLRVVCAPAYWLGLVLSTVWMLVALLVLYPFIHGWKYEGPK